MSHTQEYQLNYNALLMLPIVQDLMKQNKKLSKRNHKLSARNKSLKNLIYSLPEFRNSCCCNSHSTETNVVVKTEKIDPEPSIQSDDDTDDVIVIDPSPSINEQMHYEIIELDDASHLEEAEEEAEEEEEEEVFETTINGKAYYTTNEKNGVIYAIMPDEDIGDEVGNFVSGKAVFLK